MRWKNRPLFIFAKTSRYAKHQGPIACYRDLKKRWGLGRGESALNTFTGFPRWGGRIWFPSGGDPGEKAKLLSCLTLWPVNT